MNLCPSLPNCSRARHELETLQPSCKCEQGCSQEFSSGGVQLYKELMTFLVVTFFFHLQPTIKYSHLYGNAAKKASFLELIFF
jgi:hypothetical protein